jgi:DNA polymerase III subunit delta'
MSEPFDASLKLSELPWFQPAVERAFELLQQGRTPHAQLISAPAGYGVAILAAGLQAMYLCQAPSARGACGSCRSCHLLGLGHHPDAYQLARELNDKKVLSEFIRIDQLRELAQSLAMLSQLGGLQVAWINEAERMNTEAANGLLKTLEEPSRDTLLLLSTEQPARLLATVRSRCQRLHWPVVAPIHCRDWLQAKASISPSAAELLLKIAGAPLKALAFASKDRHATLKNLARHLAAAVQDELSADQWLAGFDRKQLADSAADAQSLLALALAEPAAFRDFAGISAFKPAANSRLFMLYDGFTELRKGLHRPLRHELRLELLLAAQRSK